VNVDTEEPSLPPYLARRAAKARRLRRVSLESGTAAEVYVRPFRVSEQTGQPSFAALPKE